MCQVGAASLLLNYAVSVHGHMDDETQVQVLSVLAINFLTFITGTVGTLVFSPNLADLNFNRISPQAPEMPIEKYVVLIIFYRSRIWIFLFQRCIK